MKSFCVVAFLAIFIGYSFGIPAKVHGYDEYMLQNNLKQQLNQNEENYGPYQVYRTLDSIGGGHLLRDLNAIYSADKTTLKNEKNARLSGLLMKLLHHIDATQGEKNDIDPFVSGSGYPSKRTIDSIADRIMAYQRLLDEGRQIGNKIKIMANHLQRNMINKRNFDEIDRAGFTNVKRNFDEIDRAGFNFVKKDFDEIDAAGFR